MASCNVFACGNTQHYVCKDCGATYCMTHGSIGGKCLKTTCSGNMDLA